MNLNDPYTQNSLHFKPFSAYLARNVLCLAASIEKNEPKMDLPGRAITVLSKATTVAGALFILPLVLIEITASLALASVSMALWKLSSGNCRKFLEKHSLKTLSFSLHSAGLLASMLKFAFSDLDGLDLKNYFSKALWDNILYLGSAILVQQYCAPYFGLSHALVKERSINLLKDCHPDLIKDFLSQIEKDLGVQNTSFGGGRIENEIELEEYFSRHADDLEFIQNLDYSRVFYEENERKSFLALLQKILVESGIMLIAQPNEQHIQPVEIIDRPPEEITYRSFLINTLQNCAFQLYQNNMDEYGLLTRDGIDGKELLKNADARIWKSLANLAVVSEAMQENSPIRCPLQFSPNFSRYNQRMELLSQLKDNIQQLDQNTQGTLYTLILTDAEPEDRQFKDVIDLICLLRNDLLEGPLMKSTIFHMDAIGGESEVIELRNLFEKALTEAADFIREQETQELYGIQIGFQDEPGR